MSAFPILQLKNKFCLKCREGGFRWPADRVRQLGPDNPRGSFLPNDTKAHRAGFWKRYQDTQGRDLDARFINTNNRLKTMPTYCIFKEPPGNSAEDVVPGCLPVPAELVQSDGCARLQLVNGTIELRGKIARELAL